jgi:hypothetical protein
MREVMPLELDMQLEQKYKMERRENKSISWVVSSTVTQNEQHRDVFMNHTSNISGEMIEYI